MRYVGIDFGTTNSAVALADDAGDVALVPLAGAPHWRTVLFFEADGRLHAGAPAIARYLETEGDGRLIQSIKSHLASATFSRTTIAGRRYALEDLIAAFLRQVRAASPVDLGTRAVVGRPVRYWGAEGPDDDERALSRMRAALATAGFTEVVFELEPVGAAARYGSRRAREELIVVADFGGGTTDFSVVRVPAGEVLASGGIGVSGDAFDARIIDALVAPALGRGTRYRDEMGAIATVPVWIFGQLRRWHYLSFLKEESTMRLLGRILQGTEAPEAIERLVHLVDDNLGLPLHRAVEGSKVRLTVAERDRVVFDELDLDLDVTRPAFERWIDEDLDVIDGVLDDVLARAGVRPEQVERVFATGGSSLVPAVRARLGSRFGVEKVVGGEELTSVAWGLAARAFQLFR